MSTKGVVFRVVCDRCNRSGRISENSLFNGVSGSLRDELMTLLSKRKNGLRTVTLRLSSGCAKCDAVVIDGALEPEWEKLGESVSGS